MTKLTILLVLFGVGGTAAYELNRKTEAAPIIPIRDADPAPPVLVQRAQVPGGSDTHPVSVFYAQHYPAWRFRSEVVSSSGTPPAVAQTVRIYATGPAGHGGPYGYNSLPFVERWWEQVGTSGNEETWRSIHTATVRMP